MDEIIDKIKSNNKYFWFIPKGDRLSLIAQGKSKSEVKEIFKNKLLNLSTNPEKYHNQVPVIFMIYIKVRGVGSFFKVGEQGQKLLYW